MNTAEPEPIVDLAEVNRQLKDIDQQIEQSRREHNEFLRELGLEGV